MKNKKKIIIADDSKMNQELLAEILGDQYQYTYADNGAQLLDYLNQDIDVDIILLDINMPLMDGFEVLEIMNQRRWLDEIPVVVISAESDVDFLQKAYSLGATDYIPRPFSAVTVRFRVKNTLMLYSKQRQLVQLVEEQVYEREEINNAMINIFSHTIELRNNESGQHTLSVRNISDILLHRLAELTDRYDLTEKSISVIATLSALHDIGKIVIPAWILNKPDRLTPKEFEIMKTHTTAGDEIIKKSAIPQSTFVIKTAREICRWHHERWDGRGYPDGLSGDQIPISAQVVSLADVYDALTSERCYKKAFSHEQAVEMICNGQCGAFNPLLLQCFRDAAPKLKALSSQKETAFDYANEAQILTLEMLTNHNLPLDDRSRRILANEREKKEFFKKQAGGIQFEYDCSTHKVNFTDWYNSQKPTQELYYSQSEMSSMLSEEDLQRLYAIVEQMSRENPDGQMDVLLEVGGSYRWHRLTLHSMWSQKGQERTGILGQFQDIHDEITKAGVNLLLEKDTNASTALEFLNQIFHIVRLVDPQDYRVLKITEDGEIIETPFRCYELWHRNCCCENCSSAQATKCKGLATKMETRDGKLYAIISKYQKVGGRDLVLELGLNLSDLEGNKNRDRLPERTRLMLLDFYKDTLTDTYSRMYLEDFRTSLEEAIAVAVIDVDGFKRINDTYGHVVGDMALKHIAQIIEAIVGECGVVIRYGGDEFLVLFHAVSEYVFRAMLKDMQRSVHQSTLPEYPQLQLDISVGGAYHAATLLEGIEQADKEMYHNKPEKNGGGTA